MPIISSYVIPHGAILLNPEDEVTEKLRHAVDIVCSLIAEDNPDVILLSSPHAIANSYDFCLFLNGVVEGSAEWDGKYSEYAIRADIDLDLSRDMVQHLSVNNSVSGITANHPSLPMPIRWGEVIPLYLIAQKFKDLPPVVILSQPTRRHEEGVEMATELRRLGKNIDRYFQERPERVVFVVSGDLSHTHNSDGPYGYSETASLFDQAFSNWVNGSNDDLFTMISLQNQALSCGFTSFLILEGIREHHPNWKGTCYENSAPSYYGMGVVSFR